MICVFRIWRASAFDQFYGDWQTNGRSQLAIRVRREAEKSEKVTRDDDNMAAEARQSVGPTLAITAYQGSGAD